MLPYYKYHCAVGDGEEEANWYVSFGGGQWKISSTMVDPAFHVEPWRQQLLEFLMNACVVRRLRSIVRSSLSFAAARCRFPARLFPAVF